MQEPTALVLYSYAITYGGPHSAMLHRSPPAGQARPDPPAKTPTIHPTMNAPAQGTAEPGTHGRRARTARVAMPATNAGKDGTGGWTPDRSIPLSRTLRPDRSGNVTAQYRDGTGMTARSLVSVKAGHFGSSGGQLQPRDYSPPIDEQRQESMLLASPNKNRRTGRIAAWLRQRRPIWRGLFADSPRRWAGPIGPSAGAG
jgi:hypothetical protein